MEKVVKLSVQNEFKVNGEVYGTLRIKEVEDLDTDRFVRVYFLFDVSKEKNLIMKIYDFKEFKQTYKKLDWDDILSKHEAKFNKS